MHVPLCVGAARGWDGRIPCGFGQASRWQGRYAWNCPPGVLISGGCLEIMKIFLVVLCRTVSSSMTGVCTRHPWQIVRDISVQPRCGEGIRGGFLFLPGEEEGNGEESFSFSFFLNGAWEDSIGGGRWRDDEP